MIKNLRSEKEFAGLDPQFKEIPNGYVNKTVCGCGLTSVALENDLDTIIAVPTIYLAINKAMDLAEKTANLPVPLHLRNAPTKLMKEQGYGVDYLYPHNYPEHFVLQDYLPPELKGTKLYESARNKREVEGERLQQRRWQQTQS